MSVVSVYLESALMAAFDWECLGWPISFQEVLVNYHVFLETAFETPSSAVSLQWMRDQRSLQWMHGDSAQRWWVKHEARSVSKVLSQAQLDVHCLVPIVLPTEAEQMFAVADTWGRACDRGLGGQSARH